MPLAHLCSFSSATDEMTDFLDHGAPVTANFFSDFDVSRLRQDVIDRSFEHDDLIRILQCFPCLPISSGFPWLTGDYGCSWSQFMCTAQLSAPSRKVLPHHCCGCDYGFCQNVLNLSRQKDYVPVVSFILLCHYFQKHLRDDFCRSSDEPACYMVFMFVCLTEFIPLLERYLLPLVLK